jgi:hypothetical protein
MSPVVALRSNKRQRNIQCSGGTGSLIHCCHLNVSLNFGQRVKKPSGKMAGLTGLAELTELI